ncbi:MAG: hypothetical protein IID08_07905 [Candidatus Hydrogenedentes bacterium]|nr:hypothetical protein [Candidatus Hydrogenedentota bacterium]
MSSCLNHPSVAAIGRCKQCGKPFCGACEIKGPTGNFCSDECKGLHETFVQRAAKLDDMKKKRSGLGAILKKIVVLGIVLLVVAFGADFMGIEIPVLSEFVEGLLNR